MTYAPREHSASPERDPNPAPETTYAERARTLLEAGKVGLISTQSRKRPGYPFGSLMPYALDSGARPLFLISAMAMHTQNIADDRRASLCVADLAARRPGPPAEDDPLGAARLTVLGDAGKIPAPDVGTAREIYLARHANARYWVDFKDFAFYRLEVVDAYFVGGFGVMGWVDAGEFRAAAPDPLAPSAAGILEHMNSDHADSLLLIARAIKGIAATEARMTAVDRLGFHVRLKTQGRVRGARIAFPREVRTPEQCREALIAMTRHAIAISGVAPK